jgi:hypothetical protein
MRPKVILKSSQGIASITASYLTLKQHSHLHQRPLKIPGPLAGHRIRTGTLRLHQSHEMKHVQQDIENIQDGGWDVKSFVILNQGSGQSIIIYIEDSHGGKGVRGRALTHLYAPTSSPVYPRSCSSTLLYQLSPLERQP